VTEWIGAADAAQRLGIKPASLYSYVSRGVLTPRRSSDGRASLFDAAEIAGLAQRGRPRRAGGAELVIESELTEISEDHLRFRGHDAIALATSRSFEDVAGLLWTGSFGDAVARGPWQATSEAIAAGTAAQAALPPDTYPLERLQVIVPAVAATDRLRLHLDRPAVIAAASSLIAAMVDCLPATGQLPADSDDSIAGRLAPKLCPQPPGAGLVAALRAALVLAADHELAASTLAARVAASVRADPYAVVGTGLGAMSGALHGGASLGAEVLLASAAESDDAPRVVGELLRRGERIPGLGHFVYQAGDPRAILLLDLVRKAAPDSDRLAVAEAVLAEARRRALPAPNIEFALAVLATVGGMIPGAGEAVFAIARTAGWLAHALEEYARATPIRPRGVYTGHAAIT
jgi:citrate synthase